MKATRIQWGGLALAVLWVSGCTSYYTPRPIFIESPQQMPVHLTVPETKVSVGILLLDTPKLVHFFFSKEGLLRQNILPVLVSITSKDSNIYSVTPHSFYFEDSGKVYEPISPAEAFDIAWQSKHPYIVVKKTLFYTALIVFTVVTLGLGSMIWVLPTPFSQPKPPDDPFGRDLIYKSFPKKITIEPGTTSGGMLYFYMHKHLDKLQKEVFLIHLTENTSTFSVKSASMTFRISDQEDEQNTIDFLDNFFNY
jgi:hypothetical protein